MLQNKPLMLGIVALLVFLRFVLVPWQAYQEELHQQLDALSKRLQRSEALLSQQQQLNESQAQLQQQLTTLLQPFPAVEAAAQYRLQLQQQLQQLAAEHQVSVTFFDWLSDTPLNVFNLQRARINLRLQGNAASVMAVHLLLEQRYTHFIIRDLRGSWRGAISPDSQVEFTLLIEADYRQQDAVNAS